ncbi:MAG: chorismate synthase [Phycisphaeraceae bacterium]|nr:chorismate synthase [Phycisphaerales bacterium]MCB9859150.1 chorismate synthase [Phycisphaeraceae bacterium]
MAGRNTGLDYGTAGESHGPCVLATITGLPAGLAVDTDFINAELARRQGGYGRGGRQKIETDRAEFLSGVRLGKAIGSPLTISVVNRDSRLDDLERTPPVSRPRPGHADLAGAIKTLTTDCRNTLERASARETAGRVAAGAVARCLLREIGVEVFGFVRSIGGVRTNVTVDATNWRDALIARNASETYCPDDAVTSRQCELIRQAKIDKDTLGGMCEVHVFGCPIGLGSTVDWRDKLDANIALAVMSIQAFKSVEIGMGRDVADVSGSQVHDPIGYDASLRSTPALGFVRSRNNAGGIEGGMTNGQPIVVRGAMKPISTLLQGMPSIDLNTLQPEQSQYERSDVCAVSAASVVMENVVAFEIARAAMAKYAGDTVDEFVHAWQHHLDAARKLATE